MKSKNYILKILESLGKVFPVDIESVEKFEKKFQKEIKEAKPKHWDDPLQILKDGVTEQITTKNPSELFTSSGLAQAAREGNMIPDEIKNKMLEDRKNAEKS